MKTPPRDPCKRTRGTMVTHLGAFKTQLVININIHPYLTNLVACYRTQFLTDHYNDPFLSSVCVCMYVCMYVHAQVSE